MKPLSILFKVVAVILVSAVYLRCSIVEPDECDGSKAPEISVSIQASIHILGKNNLPMKDERVTVTISKLPCGNIPKGVFTWQGFTDAGGDFNTTVANYDLRNSKDAIEVEVEGHDIILGGNADSQTEKDFVYYRDFIPGTIKTVDITLYTNQ